MSTSITGNTFLIKKKLMKLLGSDFRIYDASEKEILFAHLKAFKLKEDITLYTDESKSTAVLNIKARSIMDFSSAYDFYDVASGQKVGAAKRKGFQSILRDEWILMAADSDTEIGKIQEDSMLMALLRRLVTNLIPQKFDVSVDGQNVGRYQNNFNPFISKVSVHIHNPEKFNPLFALGMGVLLCAIEGKQR
ncbi:MAG: hypothetical protein ACK5D5_08025 [Bacteroidota bacterium]|jgi:uncharacterized protein YxjI